MNHPSKDCLVLNASWVPIETVSWQDAFIKIFNGGAFPVEYYEDVIRTPSDEFLKPAVIVCTKYNGRPERSPIYSKRMVYIRDSYMCQYCGAQLTSDDATIDHVLPRAQGGRSSFENTVAACEPCNKRKADKTPEQARMKLMRPPTKPKNNPIKRKFGGMAIQDKWKLHLEHYLRD